MSTNGKDEWREGTVYMRHISGGTSYIQEHHCWNTRRFIEYQQDACKQANAKLKDGEPRASIELVTREEYNAARFKGKARGRV